MARQSLINTSALSAPSRTPSMEEGVLLGAGNAEVFSRMGDEMVLLEQCDDAGKVDVVRGQ
ncbi:hypothetical protein L7F22_045095, partial [Adiantum nelumboides]|nr:hypothetical protein [Adiantum nelumboides]